MIADELNETKRRLGVEKIKSRCKVIGALILRDMRTRFGRSHLGYLIAIAWPLVHLTVIVCMVSLANRVMPLGTESSVFVATGVIPYILCLYPARMMCFAIDSNKSLFLFPVIRPIDMIVARAVVEFLTAFTVVFIFCITLYAFGVDIMPPNVALWASSLLATVYFSICFGVLNTVCFTLFKMWNAIFIGCILIMYASSGTFALPQTFSPEVRAIIWFNPLLHCVEWLRSAYYEGYGDDMLSKTYLLWFSTFLLFLGLTGERFLRGKLMSS
ncbi:hypothetical protein FS782_26075 [Agrobacterium vitis]|uniref:ABC transporter permease n=1 Tax=Agrobacterium vitis TaxID=373 RepID=UPI001F353B3C|nr:ABC transporter permease [Agrobacterium vitis]MCF1480478.1 hypothetical protein [Agrobacterium vitis]